MVIINKKTSFIMIWLLLVIQSIGAASSSETWLVIPPPSGSNSAASSSDDGASSAASSSETWLAIEPTASSAASPNENILAKGHIYTRPYGTSLSDQVVNPMLGLDKAKLSVRTPSRAECLDPNLSSVLRKPRCYIMEQPAIDTALAAFMEAQALLDKLSYLLEAQMGNKASSLIYDIQLLLTRTSGKTYLTYKSNELTIERNNAYVQIFLDNEKEDPLMIIWGIHGCEDIIQYQRSAYKASRYRPPSGCFHGRLDPRESRRTVNMYNLESEKSSRDIKFTTELFQQDFSSVCNDEGYQGLFLADLPIGHPMPALAAPILVLPVDVTTNPTTSVEQATAGDNLNCSIL